MRATAETADLRIVVVQHEPGTTLGSFAELLVRAEVELVRVWRDALPEPDELDGVIALGGSIIANLVPRVPYLGICLGGQLVAAALGAPVHRGPRPEIGMHDVYLTEAARSDPLFTGLPGRLRVLEWHGDTFALPRGAVPLAGSISYRYQAFRWGRLGYGVQFHPEATPRAVAEWPRIPGYLDQLEAAGLDAQEVLCALQREEPRVRRLAGSLLTRWLGLCARVASSARAGNRTRAAAA